MSLFSLIRQRNIVFTFFDLVLIKKLPLKLYITYKITKILNLHGNPKIKKKNF